MASRCLRESEAALEYVPGLSSDSFAGRQMVQVSKGRYFYQVFGHKLDMWLTLS